MSNQFNELKVVEGACHRVYCPFHSRVAVVEVPWNKVLGYRKAQTKSQVLHQVEGSWDDHSPHAVEVAVETHNLYPHLASYSLDHGHCSSC